MTNLLDIILHLDTHLTQWIAIFGPWTYGVIFLIIFAETGFVVTPFLPGDSLLFAVGALSVVDGSPINIHLMTLLLITAGILGDFLNYNIGHYLGPKVFHSQSSKLLNKEHLFRTQAFYEKYGPMTIIFARFVPIIRTFAPFVAGIGKMKYSKFGVYNIIGASIWVTLFMYAGYFFGNLPSVKRNFHFVIFGVLIVSVLPILLGWIKSRIAKNQPNL